MGRSAARKASNNHLLSALSSGDYALLEQHLVPVRLDVRLVIEDANKPIKQICFPEDGIVSVVSEGPGTRQIEIGLIGCEGMTGLSVLMGDGRSPHKAYVQVAGHAHFMNADALRDAMRKSATMRDTFLHFAQAFMIQTASTAVANGRANIDQRLARWLLMAHDRLEGDELPLTHEFLALMLSVRRAGVTEAVQVLTSRNLITAYRGRIQVTNRSGLEAAANGLYGIPEAEYRRLTGWRPKH